MSRSFSFLRGVSAALSLGLVLASSALAQDASIDRLLNKLPPPEKLVKPPVKQAMEQPDPAFKDPMGRQISRAIEMYNFPQALNLSRKLTERYPHSAASQCLRGALAFDLRQLGEASSCFRAATNIQPKFALAHFCLAWLEAAQEHYAAAIPHLQRLAELEPKAYVSYYALSDCTLRLGRKQESLDYAKKAAALAPSVVYTWLQLSRAEKAIGHNEATLAAITKAAE